MALKRVSAGADMRGGPPRAYDPGMDTSRWVRRTGAFVLVALLAGCGGGVWIGWGDDDDWPDVSLVSSASSAIPGQTLRLSAAASDDDGIDHVDFYRIGEGGGWVHLGEDGSEPYQVETAVPSTSATRVRYIARAVDRHGNWADSDTVSVEVTH